jgi:hypothetical protein
LLADEGPLQAETVFEWLQRRFPGTYRDGQVVTLQRRVRHWRAIAGPVKEVMFPQMHTPGRLCASDFTYMNGLRVIIGGQEFAHKVFHFVLTYSNWETANPLDAMACVSFKPQWKRPTCFTFRLSEPY